MTAERLADSLRFDPRLVAAWCRAAYAFEALDWDESGGYVLPDDEATILLDATDPRYLGGRIRFYTGLHEDFRAYPRLLASGGVWPRSAHDPELIQALADLSQPDVRMLTDHVIPEAASARAAIEAGGALLEVGSGTGHHLIQYAVTYPLARIVGIEIDPASVDLARAALVSAGLDERVELRSADANALDDEGAFDLVVMNITLHETGGPADWGNVLRRAHRALRAGGSVVVSELPYPDSVRDFRTDKVYQMLAGVQLHEVVVGCGTITQGVLGRLLEDAGFANVRVAEQPMRTRFVMLGDRL